jgi:hypothetical protein
MKLFSTIQLKRYVVFMALFFICHLAFPQQAYFQQEVNYKMNVVLNDSLHSLSALEEITYINRSPQQLEFIYFHLWPNAYKNNETALAKQLLKLGRTELYFSKASERGYIDSIDFKVNGKSIKWEYDKEHIDICKLILNEPLKPGESIIITTPFYLKIPDAKFSRLGHTGQAYYITQWYPKPAVFDNTGWHQMPYLDQGEFYSEFGTFDVTVSLPENYLLCATGDRVDANDEEQLLKRKAQETRKHIDNLDYKKAENSFPPSSKNLKTIRFKQSLVHDFAWFADKRFYILNEQIELPHSKRRVETWVYFTPANAELWKDAIHYVSESTVFYSQVNGDYPYNQVTAVDGSIMAGGGMEYPNITVIGEAGSAIELDMTIAHEVGHNWFYGILGSNERDFPFMDEGINSLCEMRYMRAKYPNKKIAEFVGRNSTFKLFGVNKIPLWRYHEISFFTALRKRTDQPIKLSSTEFSETNYGSVVYSKTALVFDYLLDYMGENNFNTAMQVYFERYKFKHPSPDDLFKTLSEVSGKDLSAFQKHLINSTDHIDYAIKKVKQNDDGGFSLKIKNKTGSVLPFNIYSYKDKKPVGVTWFEGFEKSRTVSFPSSQADCFKIDGLDRMPDINRKNNSIKTHGLFKHSKPLKFSLLTTFEDPARTNINFLPIGARNFYNGGMYGLALHNYGFYQKRFEWLVAPMFAFNTKTPVGFVEFNFNLYPKKIFRQIVIGTKAKTFAYDYYNTGALNERFGTNFKDLYLNYYKIAPYIQFELKKKDATSSTTQFITYQNNNLFTDSVDFSSGPAFATAGPAKKNTFSFVNQLIYNLANKRAIDPFNLVVNLQHTASMAKISATLNYQITVGKGKRIDVRLFAGTFITGSQAERGYYAFRASGYNGWHDYLFENSFFARNERTGFGFTQFTEKDGALKVWTPLGQTPEWLASLNLKSPGIFKLPLRIFADVVTCDARALNKDKFLWDAGLNIVLLDEIIEIYIPFVYNDDIKKTHELNNVDLVHTIRFTFNIHKLVPKNIIQNSLF